MLLNGFDYDKINTMRIINDIKDINEWFCRLRREFK